MSEKWIGAYWFLVLLLICTVLPANALAETSGEDRLVVFEVFRNYTDTDDIDDEPSATFQSGDAIEALREEFSEDEVIFLEYDWNDAYSPATIRGSRFAHAVNLTGEEYSPPFAMVDSGQQIIGGDPDEVEYVTDYRGMILDSQARPPLAELEAVARRSGGEIVFDVVFTNQSGFTISGAQLAYVQVILYEIVLDEDDDSEREEELLDGEVYDQATEKVVHGFGYVRIMTEVADGELDNYRIKMDEPTGVKNWANMRAVALVDYTGSDRSQPYDMLQAVDVGITEHVYFAQFGAGGNLSSDLVLTNPSAEYPVKGVIEFRDAQGELLDIAIDTMLESKKDVLDVAYSELGLVPSFNLDPYETVVFKTDPSGDLKVGSVDLAIESGESTVGGVVKFSYPGIGTAGIEACDPLSGFVVPVQTLDTGIAIHNTEYNPITLKFSLYENGELIDLGTDAGGKPINPRYLYGFGSRSHMSMYVDEYFPTLNRPEFQGTLKVEVFGGEVVATALEMGQQSGEFLSIPVIPLPEE